jgi:nitroimidazol reductase NimA-like FMN-containing flavoprotein (pyridoxamine 5'-phosphate oxidase superfamily)
MEREMRRKDRQLTRGEAETILRENEYGVLSTVCRDGYPYGLPISYVYADGKLYFHRTAEDGLIRDNIGGGRKACFTVVGKTQLLPEKFSTVYESAIAFGTVRESSDKRGILMRLVERFSPAYLEKGKAYAESAASKTAVYEFEIEQLTGKARKAR